MLESVHTVLTQPGTPVSFQGMYIHLLFDFRKLRNFQCFLFPENSGTPTFPISGNSGLRHFLILVILSCISLFTCDSIVSPCFMFLFSFMYSGLLSVPGTYLSHSLVYKYLYSVARRSELKLLLLSPSSRPTRPLLLIYSLLIFQIWKFRGPEIPTLTRTQKSGTPEGFHRC